MMPMKLSTWGALLEDLLGLATLCRLYNDNHSAQKLGYNPIRFKRNKHIDIGLYYTKQVLDDGIEFVCIINDVTCTDE